MAGFRVRFLRGSEAANNIYVGPAGEMTIDTNNWRIRLHDGEKPGGHSIPNLPDVEAIVQQAIQTALADFEPGEGGGGVSAASVEDMVPGTEVNDKAVTPMGLEAFLGQQLGIAYDPVLGDWVNDEGVVVN